MTIGMIVSRVALPDLIPMYCMRCRSMLFKNDREILVISVGLEYPAHEIPLNMGWVQYQCHSCKLRLNYYYQ